VLEFCWAFSFILAGNDTSITGRGGGEGLQQDYTTVNQCVLKSCSNALQQVEKFDYLGGVFTCVRRHHKVDARLYKTNTVLRELIDLWSQNESFQTPQGFQFKIGHCADPHLWP